MRRGVGNPGRRVDRYDPTPPVNWIVFDYHRSASDCVFRQSASASFIASSRKLRRNDAASRTPSFPKLCNNAA